ncbi:Nitrilotriacetate monooxygenase component A [Raoultella ornithinolytica]|nr:Nitrilotriacetate monooxygenase component A [Raoultella ornithinolytica]
MTSFSRDVARNFSRENMPMHAERYAVAHEFLEVTCTLWEGWQEGGNRIRRAGAILSTRKFRP